MKPAKSNAKHRLNNIKGSHEINKLLRWAQVFLNSTFFTKEQLVICRGHGLLLTCSIKSIFHIDFLHSFPVKHLTFKFFSDRIIPVRPEKHHRLYPLKFVQKWTIPFPTNIVIWRNLEYPAGFTFTYEGVSIGKSFTTSNMS